MLKELSQYENLGSPGFFYELFNQIDLAKKAWTPTDIQQHFYNKIVDGRSVFDGCVPLALAIGAIEIDGSGCIQLNQALKTPLRNQSFLSNRLLELILKVVQTDNLFYEISCSEYLSYDVIYHRIQLDIAAFPLRYSNFRQLLVNFGFLQVHPDRHIRKFIIWPKHKRLFDTLLMPEIRKRKIGLEELQEILEKKQQFGEEAEKYVLSLERVRLASHPQPSLIDRISLYDVAAGYDIISFEADTSSEHDRFIEVKSYAGQVGFYWTRNEIDTARIKGDKYFLCLVDRDQMKDSAYSPLMIRNPHSSIIEDGQGWEKRVEQYFISKV